MIRNILLIFVLSSLACGCNAKTLKRLPVASPYNVCKNAIESGDKRAILLVRFTYFLQPKTSAYRNDSYVYAGFFDDIYAESIKMAIRHCKHKVCRLTSNRGINVGFD